MDSQQQAQTLRELADAARNNPLDLAASLDTMARAAELADERRRESFRQSIDEANAALARQRQGTNR